MATWGEILNELNALRNAGPAACDIIRRKYLTLLHQHTKRTTILYATKWSQPGVPDADLISITDMDMQGFMEVARGHANTHLDLILHSPGGSPTATEAIVSYLRARFVDIRVIIPHAAMSAATMLACASNKIMMGQHSSMGPIDPQMIIKTPLGVRMIPAQSIIDQFQLAQGECQNSAKLASWLPILQQYGPALLVECTNALKLSRYLVKEWLTKYMFSNLPSRQAKSKADRLAKVLANHRKHMAHARHFNLSYCQSIGFNVEPLENDKVLQDLVLSIYHATTHTFSTTPAVKIIENHQSKAFINVAQTVVPMKNMPPQGQGIL